MVRSRQRHPVALRAIIAAHPQAMRICSYRPQSVGNAPGQLKILSQQQKLQFGKFAQLRRY